MSGVQRKALTRWMHVPEGDARRGTGDLMRKEVSVMSENTSQQYAGGCAEHPVWAALDKLGVEYERVSI